MSFYESWHTDYYEHHARAERAQSDRDAVRSAISLWASYKPFYPRMVLQYMPWGIKECVSSYAIDESHEWEYAGGSPYYRRLLSADINAEWVEIKAWDLPKGLRWVNPVDEGEEFEALRKSRLLSLMSPRLEELADEVIAFAYQRKLRGKQIDMQEPQGLEHALRDAKSFYPIEQFFYRALLSEIYTMRKWEASLAPKTPIYGRDALVLLRGK